MANAKVTDAGLDKALAAFKAAVPISCTGVTMLINESPGIYCALGGMRVTLLFNGQNAIKSGKTVYHNENELTLIRCPALNIVKGGYRYVPQGEFISQMFNANTRFLDLEARKGVIHKELNTQIAAIDQMLASVSTQKQLLELWPEAKALIPKPDSTKPTAKLPAIPVTKLNAMFNLPE